MSCCLRLITGLVLCAIAAGAEADFDVASWTTTNGARVVFVPAPEIPMIDMRVVFAAGSARDGSAAGLANVVNGLLSDGAGELDADRFSAALGATGAILGSGSQRDMAYVSLRTLSEGQYAEPAVHLFIDAIARPRFEEQALVRAKARALIGLKHKQQSPEDIAEDTFFASLYASHPYASPPDGTEASVSAIARDDVLHFHRRYYVARNAVIAIVGALDRAQAQIWAEKISAPLPSGDRAPDLPAVASTRASARHVDFPSIQSHVRVGLPGVSRGDPDYFPLLVGNHALGGNSLSSILSREIRSKRGLSYSVYSYFTPMAQPGPFVAVLQTDRKQEAEALELLHATIARFVNEGPPAAELDAAKQNLVGGFPLRLASNDQIAEYIAMIGFYDLPLDYIATFTSKVAAVTPSEVKDAFHRRIALDQMITVIVGRADDGKEL